MKHIPYAAQWIDEADIKAVSNALKSDFLTQGPKVEEFEKKVARYCGAKYAVAVNSGTSALHAACFAAGIGPGDEVVTSPITFVASANCILYCGGRPVFADVEEATVNIDPVAIKRAITAKTKAIIPVHFAGQPADMKEIRRLSKKHGLFVIEDACHALGATYKGSKIGSCKFSDMTVLSFHAVKHITTGEGGMILTNNKKLYQKLLMFRSHGITRNVNKLADKTQGDWYYEMQFLGYNYRITDFQCALGLSQLVKVEKFIAARREIAKRYSKDFGKIKGIITPIEKDGIRSSWHLYSVRIEVNRKRIFQKLRKMGVGVNVHYIPVYWQPYYKRLGFAKGLCPVAERYYQRAISLPIFPKMMDTDIAYVVNAVKTVMESEK